MEIIGNILKAVMTIHELTGRRKMLWMQADIPIQKIWIELDFWIDQMIISPSHFH